MVGRGHEAIRATHAKTLEFTSGADITERATCVVAVGTGGAPERVAGPVRITLAVAGQVFTVRADANSAWQPGGSAVIRRGPLRLPGTLAVNADAAAADLPPAFVSALQDPRNPVEITVEARPGPLTLVLYAADPTLAADPRLDAEIAAADTVLAQDGAARRLTSRHDRSPDIPAGRLLIVATDGLPGAGLPWRVDRVETVGLPPPLAAAAAAPGLLGARGPVVLAGTADVLTAADRRIPGDARLVVTTDRRRLPAVLDQAARVTGNTVAVVAAPLSDPVLVRTGEVPDFPGADQLACCIATPDRDDADPAVLAVIDGLLTDGVATRTAARALAGLTGWSNRRAYDAVLDRRAVTPPARLR